MALLEADVNYKVAKDFTNTVTEKAIGENTTECMQSGIVFGTAAMLDGMFRRIKKELGYDSCTLVATGGYSTGIIPCCEEEIIYDENLLLDGLKRIYELV
jgi:type III pantothenate kinase